MVKLFSRNSNLCDHNPPTSQTDRQTTCDRNTALCTKVHRAVKTKTKQKNPSVTQIVEDANDKLGYLETFYQTHIIQYTTYCPNRPHTNTNLEPGATIDSYSVKGSLTTVILSPDFCLKTVINHTSSSSFILSQLSLVAYCFIFLRNILVISHSIQPQLFYTFMLVRSMSNFSIKRTR